MKQIKISKYSSGFTFIELIIIIIILGILGVAAFSRIVNNLDPIKVRAAIEQITSDIEQSKAISMAHHDTVSIVFDTLNDSYTIYKGPSGSQTVYTDYLGSNSGVISFDQSEYEGVDISNANFGGSTQLSFDTWGNTISGGTITLNTNNIITVQTLTGQWSISTP